MPYVPPHKRHGNVAARASSSVSPSLLKKHSRNINTKKIYSDDCIRRWFLVVGSDEENNNNNNKKEFQLVPVSSEWCKGPDENKSLVILAKSEFGKIESPWLWVAEKVVDDLTLGFGTTKMMLVRYRSEHVYPRLIIRFGKVVFNSIRTLRNGHATQSTLQELKKSFNTNVTKTYLENIRYEVVTKMGLCVEETKELYYVKVFDNTCPNLTISCKCTVDQQHKVLNFYKAELNALRHFNLDVSCLDQDLDMRMTVDSKETLTNLSENEVKNLKELTDSAVIDPNVKGGLKWPLGTSSCPNNRYSVCGVWHTVTTTYRNQTLRLQVREADRYDFRTGIGGTSREVSLKLKDLSKLLKEKEDVERECVSDMLKDCLKSVWENFLRAV